MLEAIEQEAQHNGSMAELPSFREHLQMQTLGANSGRQCCTQRLKLDPFPRQGFLFGCFMLLQHASINFPESVVRESISM